MDFEVVVLALRVEGDEVVRGTPVEPSPPRLERLDPWSPRLGSRLCRPVFAVFLGRPDVLFLGCSRRRGRSESNQPHDGEARNRECGKEAKERYLCLGRAHHGESPTEDAPFPAACSITSACGGDARSISATNHGAVASARVRGTGFDRSLRTGCREAALSGPE